VDGAPTASFGEYSRVRALLSAPHGALNFADHARATGAFAAFDITAGMMSASDSKTVSQPMSTDPNSCLAI
jgi:hypothetical protein